MTDTDARARATARVEELREFYKHLGAYVLVNTILVIIDLAGGSAGTEFIGLNWAYWPIFGWGIALVLHAVSAFARPAQWEERKVQQLMEKEREEGS